MYPKCEYHLKNKTYFAAQIMTKEFTYSILSLPTQLAVIAIVIIIISASPGVS